MILRQIEEWFHAGIAGIKALCLDTISDTWEDRLGFQPNVVGTLEHAAVTYQTLAGEARRQWFRAADGSFNLTETVPANAEAEVRVPAVNEKQASSQATPAGTWRSYKVFSVPAVFTYPARMSPHNQAAVVAASTIFSNADEVILAVGGGVSMKGCLPPQTRSASPGLMI